MAFSGDAVCRWLGVLGGAGWGFAGTGEETGKIGIVESQGWCALEDAVEI